MRSKLFEETLFAEYLARIVELKNDVGRLAELYAEFFAGYRGPSDFGPGVSRFKESTAGNDLLEKIAATSKRIKRDIADVKEISEKISLDDAKREEINSNLFDLAMTLFYLRGTYLNFKNNKAIEQDEKVEAAAAYMGLIDGLRDLDSTLAARKDELGITTMNEALKKVKTMQDVDDLIR